MTRSLARELGAHNICVNAIAAGLTMSEAVVTYPDWTGKASAAGIAARAIQREQVPADLISTLIYLRSDASNFVTGQNYQRRWRRADAVAMAYSVFPAGPHVRYALGLRLNSDMVSLPGSAIVAIHALQQRVVRTVAMIYPDHLVGGSEQARRNGEAKSLGGVEIDNQLELGELHDRQIGRLLAFEDAPRIDALLAIAFHEVCAVADQSAGLRKLAPFVDRRNIVTRSQGYDQTAPAGEKRVGTTKLAHRNLPVRSWQRPSQSLHRCWR